MQWKWVKKIILLNSFAKTNFAFITLLKKSKENKKPPKTHVNIGGVSHKVQSILSDKLCRLKLFKNHTRMNNNFKKDKFYVKFYCMNILMDHSVIGNLRFRNYSILLTFWKLQGRYNRKHLASPLPAPNFIRHAIGELT